MDKCRCLFETISTFAEKHSVEIEFKLGCSGDLVIKMTRDEYAVRKKMQGWELHWLEDSDGAIIIELDMMLKEIELAPQQESEATNG